MPSRDYYVFFKEVLTNKMFEDLPLSVDDSLYGKGNVPKEYLSTNEAAGNDEVVSW